MLHVLSPGLFTTVQDLGRYGHGPSGVSPSGAADALALRIGNLLATNPENAAGLEFTLIGGALRFEVGAGIALTGSDFGATLDGLPIRPWTSHRAEPGQTLRLGPTQSGARAYLCVHGGIDVPAFLGSASTHVLSGLGGFEGRALRKGDRLQIGASATQFTPRVLRAEAAARVAPRRVLRVTRSSQSNWFAPAILTRAPYRVTEESNRMGLRLEGPALAATRPGQMITEGVPLGAIQVPPDGQPIILFVEQQTTGGYPKIANVVAADLPSVGQLRPRDEIRFEFVSPEAARALILEQEALLRSEDLFQPLGTEA